MIIRPAILSVTASVWLLALSGAAVRAEAGDKILKYRGVVYDVGLRFADTLSVEPFDPALVTHDMRVIAHELHANAVRIEGEPIDRLVAATRAAHAVGLTVLFNPWKMNVGADEARAYVREAAVAAETLRKEGVDIVFVAGCEYTIFNRGLYPGDSLGERLQWLGAQFAAYAPKSPNDHPPSLREKAAQLNDILRSFAETIRARFKGHVTYAATTFEDVDWSIFDIVGIDYYRNGETDAVYVAGLEAHRRADKPLIVMEVGSCTYEGAAARGAGGFMILQGVNPDGTGVFAGGVPPKRSEREQADYAGQQLQLLTDANASGVFIYVFSFPTYRTNEAAASDLDMVSFALVKTFPVQDPRSKAMPPWAPKEPFHRVAEFFARQSAASERR